MLTLKFYKPNQRRIVSAQSYDVSEYHSHYSVVAYDAEGKVVGNVLIVAPDDHRIDWDDSFEVCYIQNLDRHTIDAIRVKGRGQ